MNKCECENCGRVARVAKAVLRTVWPRSPAARSPAARWVGHPPAIRHDHCVKIWNDSLAKWPCLHKEET